MAMDAARMTSAHAGLKCAHAACRMDGAAKGSEKASASAPTECQLQIPETTAALMPLNAVSLAGDAAAAAPDFADRDDLRGAGRLPAWRRRWAHSEIDSLGITASMDLH